MPSFCAPADISAPSRTASFTPLPALCFPFPSSHPGLLGICLSGAGPTILALATENFELIARDAAVVFGEFGVEVDWKLLEVCEGSVIEEDGEVTWKAV